MHHLFCYGTLLDPEIQKELFHRLIPSHEGTITGFILEKISYGRGDERVTYPILKESPNTKNIIKGRLITLSDAELIIADEYEGTDYKRIQVTTEKNLEAWVYVAS